MEVEELENIVAKTEAQGLDRVILAITRKSNPKGWKVRVNGMGLGEIANVQNKNGRVEIVAWFKLADVKRYVRIYKAAIAQRQDGGGGET